MQEMEIRFLSQDDTLEKEMATHSRNFCLGNPMVRGVWQATIHGVTRVRHDLVTKQQQQHGLGLGYNELDCEES